MAGDILKHYSKSDVKELGDSFSKLGHHQCIMFIVKTVLASALLFKGNVTQVAELAVL